MANVSIEERQDMIDEMDKLMGLKDDPAIPPTAITARDYADEKGLTYDQAKNKLNRAFEMDKLKRMKAMRESGSGALCEQWVYWV